jgi:predicted unusual protein kinase regulating ubiquinone biosynthesis (AarF/ABC1/UbiB family)
MADDQASGSDGIATGRISRSIPVVRLASRATGDAVIDKLRRRAPKPEVIARRAERYAEVLGSSKGALMKAGQMLSIIPIGPSVASENRAAFQGALARLQADAPPMAPELASEVIESELGKPPGDLFAEFSPTPVAAASIGQVHEARLHNGRHVAVKVQYPGVAEAIRSDLRNTELMMVFFQLIRSVVPALSRSDPKVTAKEISDRIREELDYRNEAKNQTLFADAYRGHPFIRIPEVVPEYSTGKVLTQEFAQGLPWSEALQADQELRDSWGEVIYRFGWGSVARLTMFNADPHPGNYIFHDDGTVSFLDFGCVKQMTQQQIDYTLNHLRVSLHHGDAQALWKSFVDGGHFDAETAPTPDELLEYYSVRLGWIRGPQPLKMTPTLAAQAIEQEYSMVGPHGHVVRALKDAGDYLFFGRMDTGLMAIMGELGMIGSPRDLLTELFDDGPPATAKGEADRAFWTAKSSPA